MARIAFIGGTGPEGLGLAIRFAKAGEEVFIGSRSEQRAAEAVAKVLEKVPEGKVRGGLNAEACREGDIIFVTVPYEAHQETLASLADLIDEKILVDVVVPLQFGGHGVRALSVPEGSAAEQARALVPKAKVVSGFHHLDATLLQNVEKPMQGDVIICSDHRSAKRKVMELAEKIAYLRAVDGGVLANSRYLEEWTALLLNINRIYKARTGVRIVGI
ncbi:MAG: NADPH-dependent F420 reductase [Dehalococcoidia bacterium]|jgi:NADPH-dependent F420 reductase|nr:NADPH-dependent F420 reductase [Dehalococcoidia bacterium]MDW8009414.1 NADPH-dependent F420 reductase [Chloroflexota bacterium]